MAVNKKVLVMYRTQVNGPWHGTEIKLSIQDFDKYRMMKQRDSKPLIKKLVEMNVMGQDILDVDFNF